MFQTRRSLEKLQQVKNLSDNRPHASVNICLRGLENAWVCASEKQEVPYKLVLPTWVAPKGLLGPNY